MYENKHLERTRRCNVAERIPPVPKTFNRREEQYLCCGDSISCKSGGIVLQCINFLLTLAIVLLFLLAHDNVWAVGASPEGILFGVLAWFTLFLGSNLFFIVAFFYENPKFLYPVIAFEVINIFCEIVVISVLLITLTSNTSGEWTAEKEAVFALLIAGTACFVVHVVLGVILIKTLLQCLILFQDFREFLESPSQGKDGFIPVFSPLLQSNYFRPPYHNQNQPPEVQAEVIRINPLSGTPERNADYPSNSTLSSFKAAPVIRV